MSLQEQIQREIEQEAKLDKIIEKRIKDYSRNYRVVPVREEADAVLIFNREKIYEYGFYLISEEGNTILDMAPENIKLIYLKNRNPRDSKKATHGRIKKTASRKKFAN